MSTQAQGPAPAQVQTPVSAIHEEQATLERLTNYVSNTKDNDPHEGTEMELPKEEAQAAEPATQETQETVEFDEEAPIFDVPDMSDPTKLIKASLKQLREERMMKADYHRNIQKVKAQEAQLNETVKSKSLEAQQHYLQQLETHKQLVLKTVAPELQNVDLNKLSREDPAEAQRLFFRQLQVNQVLQQIEHEQKQAFDKFQTDQKSAFEQAKSKARETLETDIKGWDQGVYVKVLETVAKDYGFKNEEVEPVVDARLIKVFHDAYQYRQLQKAKPEISKKVVTVPKVVKPGSVQTNTSSSSTEEAAARLKKSGKGEDFVQWYMAQQKQNKRK